MQSFNFKYLNPESVPQGKHLYASQVASKPGIQLFGEISPQHAYKAKHMHEISNTLKPEIETAQNVCSPFHQKHAFINEKEGLSRLEIEKQKL